METIVPSVNTTKEELQERVGYIWLIKLHNLSN